MITIHVYADVQVANFPITIIAIIVYVAHNYKKYTYYKATLHS